MMTQIAQTPVPAASDYQFFYFPYMAVLALGNEVAKLTNRGMYAFSNFAGGWTIEGTSNAGPFSFVRNDRFTGYESPDGWFSMGAAGDALYSDLEEILYYSLRNSGEGIQIDQVTPNLEMSSGLGFYRVARSLQWKKGKMKNWSKKQVVRGLRKNQVLRVRLSLKSNEGDIVRRIMKFKATRNNGSLSLENAVEGGSAYGPNSLDELLDDMAQSSNTEVVVRTSGLKRMSGTPARISFNKVLMDVFLGLNTTS